MNEYYTVTCACDGRNPSCPYCYGTGKVIIPEQPKPGMFISGRDLAHFCGACLLYGAGFTAFVYIVFKVLSR